MGGNILALDIRDIGLIPRKNALLKNFTKLSKSIKYINSHLQLIKLDKNNEYNFHFLTFAALEYVEFYDGEEKVAEIFYDHKNSQLSLKFNVERQCNIFGDFEIGDCLVEANGPLCINGKLRIESSIELNAKAVCFIQEVVCKGQIALTVQQGVGILEHIDTRYLTIKAAYIYQSANIHVKETYSIESQALQQEENTITTANALALVVFQAEISGQILIKNNTFITATALLLGNDKSQTTAKFFGENYIHLGNCILRGDTQVTFNRNNDNENSQCIIDQVLLLESRNSLFNLKNTALDVGLVNNYGEFNTENCVNNIDAFYQKGAAVFYQSRTIIYNKFSQSKNTFSEIKKSKFTCKLTSVQNGDFLLKDSVYIGQEYQIFSGLLSIVDKSELHLNQSLLVGNNVQCILEDSKVNVMEMISVNGEANIKNSNIISKWIEFYRLSAKIESSKIVSTSQLIINDGAAIKDAYLYGENIRLSNDLRIYKLCLRANTIIFDSEMAKIEACIANAKWLDINGGAEKGNVKFKNSDLVADVISARHHITFDTSFLTGISKVNTSHTIQGNIEFINTPFVTRDQIHNIKDSHTHLSKSSIMQAGRIYSNATLDVEHSSLFSNSFLQNKAKLLLVNGTMQAKHTIFSRYSETIMAGHSVMSSEVNNYQGSLRLKEKSLLLAQKELIINYDSSAYSDESVIMANKLIMLGHGELSKSLLSVNEMRIYRTLEAKNATQIESKGLVSLGRLAEVKLLASRLKGNDINIFGYLKAEDAQVLSDRQLNCWSESLVELQGDTFVESNDMYLKGDLKLKTKIIESKANDNGWKLIPHVKIKSHFDVSEQGSIYGEDLILDVSTFYHAGDINLQGILQAKGRSCCNSGTAKARNIFLGFDDAVTNYGEFSCDNLAIQSNFYNLLGIVSAKKYFSNVGYINLNFGLISANNYTTDSLLSVNAGLVLPNFSADLQYIFSSSNIRAFAKTLLTTAAPEYTNVINFGFMIPSLIDTTTNLYHTFQNCSWESVTSMRRHEVLPLFCQVKNAALLGYNMFNTTNAVYSESKGINENFSSKFQEFMKKENFKSEKIKEIISQMDGKCIRNHLLGLVGGNYIDNSLLHANFGGSFTCNTAKTNILHINANTEYSVLSHNINSRYIYNSGYSAGNDASFFAISLHNSGWMGGRNFLKIKSDDMRNSVTGNVHGGKIDIDLRSLHQNGILNVENGRVHIAHFTDSVSSSTALTNISMMGDDLSLLGRLAANNVFFDYKKGFMTGVSSIISTSNVAIKTQEFKHGGHWDFADHLGIAAATSARFLPKSEIHGQKTPKDKLFAIKETRELSSTESTSSIEKEFKPQHILDISTNEVTLSGKLDGGDYTKIHDSASTGTQCRKLTTEVTSDIQLSYGTIDSVIGDFSGKVDLDHFNININSAVLNQEQHLRLSNVDYVGNIWRSQGHLALENMRFASKYIKLYFPATETISNSLMLSENAIDESQLFYNGNVSIKTNQYTHFGHIAKTNLAQSIDENFFYLKADSATLQGSACIDYGYYDIKFFGDNINFINGTSNYKHYHFSDHLTFSTDEKLVLNKDLTRQCDLTLRASDIELLGGYNQQQTLSLISTNGDIYLIGNIAAQNLYVYSASHIYNNNIIYAADLINFKALKGYYNLGGSINCNVVAVQASEIKNITGASAAASNRWPIKIGGQGIINGRAKVFLEATQQNIENHGGVISGGEYTQLVAKNDVLNLCNETSYKAKYDTRKKFSPGLIAGGNGSTTDGLGLYVRANGKIISDASDFISEGDNYLEGIGGVDFKARYHTYISKNEKKRKYLKSKKKHTIETSTDIKESIVHSNHGRNVICSSLGEISTIATQFISPGGTDIYAKDEIKLFSLKTQDSSHTSKSSWWGLKSTDRDKILSNSTPTLFVDHGITRIHSAESNVDARGAYFLGTGDLLIKAEKRIKFGVDILTQEVREKTQSFGISAPGLRAWNAFNQDGSWCDILSAEDTTLAKMHALTYSNNLAEGLANTANMSIDLFNTINSVFRGINNASLGAEALSRYGLGGMNGFSPIFNLSMTQTKTMMTYQIQAVGGVDRGGSAKFEANEGIDLENGVTVKVKNDMELDAPELRAHAAALNSSYSQKIHSANVSLTPTTGVTDVGISYSSTHSQSIHYENASLVSTNGNIKLHHQGNTMKVVELVGANILAKTFDANIGNLYIADKQDTYQMKTTTSSINSSGQISFYQGHSDQCITNQRSGIHIQDGLNTDGHIATAQEAHMQGGEITTDGINNFTAESLFATTVVDKRKYQGTGCSINVHEVTQLFDQKTPINAPGEKAITTATVILNCENFEAKQIPVMYGKEGVSNGINRLTGEICSDSACGEEITKNNSMNLEIDVPLCNVESISMTVKNLCEGTTKILKALNLKTQEVLSDVLISVNEEENQFSGISKPEEAYAEKEKLDNLDTLESKTNENVCQELISKAVKDLKNNGQISEKTEHELSNKLLDAIILSIKTGAEVGWDKIIDNLGEEYTKNIIKLLSDQKTRSKAVLKLYFQKTGILFTFGMNAALVSAKHGSVKDTISDAVFATAGDIIFTYFLNTVAGPTCATPIGLIWVGAQIADAFLYDEKLVEKCINDSFQIKQNTFKECFDGGSYLEYYGRKALADEMYEGGMNAKVAHHIIQLPSHIADGCKFLWEEVIRSNPKKEHKARIPMSEAELMERQGIFHTQKSIPTADVVKNKLSDRVSLGL